MDSVEQEKPFVAFLQKALAPLVGVAYLLAIVTNAIQDIGKIGIRFTAGVVIVGTVSWAIYVWRARLPMTLDTNRSQYRFNRLVRYLSLLACTSAALGGAFLALRHDEVLTVLSVEPASANGSRWALDIVVKNQSPEPQVLYQVDVELSRDNELAIIGSVTYNLHLSIDGGTGSIKGGVQGSPEGVGDVVTALDGKWEFFRRRAWKFSTRVPLRIEIPGRGGQRLILVYPNQADVTDVDGFMMSAGEVGLDQFFSGDQKKFLLRDFLKSANSANLFLRLYSNDSQVSTKSQAIAIE